MLPQTMQFWDIAIFLKLAWERYFYNSKFDLNISLLKVESTKVLSVQFKLLHHTSSEPDLQLWGPEPHFFCLSFSAVLLQF